MCRHLHVSRSKSFPTWQWLRSSNRSENLPIIRKYIYLYIYLPYLNFLTSNALDCQVFFEYGFHPRVQRWIIGQCLCTDPRSLASYGVQKDGDTAYLYLISARQARITRQLFQQDLESTLLGPTLPPGNGPTSQDRRGYSTLPSRLPHNNQGEFTQHTLFFCSQNVNFHFLTRYLKKWSWTVSLNSWKYVKIMFSLCKRSFSSYVQVAQVQEVTDQLTSKISMTWSICSWTITPAKLVKHRYVGSKCAESHLPGKFQNFFLKPCQLASSQQTEWACPSCTFINKPSRPGCEICATARPDSQIQQVVQT